MGEYEGYDYGVLHWIRSYLAEYAMDMSLKTLRLFGVPED